MKWSKSRNKNVVVAEPREAIPVFINVPDGHALQRGIGTVTLEKISMKTIRKNFGFPPIVPETYKNLQIWLDHLGPALYNPVWWRYHKVPLGERRTRYPHRIGHYEILHGCHRLRALERCDFPYIFALIHRGPTYVNPSNPNWVRNREIETKLKLNVEEPIIYTFHGICEKCGASVRWGGPPKGQGGTDNYKSTLYNCGRCGFNGRRPEIYPEPV